MLSATAELRAMALKRPRVLIADDMETVRKIASKLLERMGCDVDAAENGEQALALAGQIRYNLILLDLDMPLMDGTEAARAIRSLPKNGATLIVAVSAYLEHVGESADRWRVFDCELPKPISLHRLRQVISAVPSAQVIEAGPVYHGRLSGIGQCRL